MSNRLALGVLMTLAMAATAARAASGAGPYYAPPAWSQKLACTSPANCPRFVVLSDWNNEAVLDRETGLVWERTVSGQTGGLAGRAAYCLTLTAGGRAGWRLPTAQELNSLRDPAVLQEPVLPPGHPFIDVPLGERFWSTTASSAFPDNRWAVGFSVLLSMVSGQVGGTHRGWCVRGAGTDAAH